jgi:hypothetical protein
LKCDLYAEVSARIIAELERYHRALGEALRGLDQVRRPENRLGGLRQPGAPKNGADGPRNLPFCGPSRGTCLSSLVVLLKADIRKLDARCHQVRRTVPVPA